MFKKIRADNEIQERARTRIYYTLALGKMSGFHALFDKLVVKMYMFWP